MPRFDISDIHLKKRIFTVKRSSQNHTSANFFLFSLDKPIKVECFAHKYTLLGNTWINKKKFFCFLDRFFEVTRFAVSVLEMCEFQGIF